MPNTQTLRDSAREMVRQSAAEYAAFSHQVNYHRLHVRRDGTVTWFEAINKSDDLIDGEAKKFQAIQSVGVTGEGGYACNCDHCNDPGYESIDEAIHAAVADSDLTEIEEMMSRAFDEIPPGYFHDEDEPDEPRYEDDSDVIDIIEAAKQEWFDAHPECDIPTSEDTDEAINKELGLPNTGSLRGLTVDLAEWTPERIADEVKNGLDNWFRDAKAEAEADNASD